VAHISFNWADVEGLKGRGVISGMISK